jgi:uncharacterized protein (DUF697 family)
VSAADVIVIDPPIPAATGLIDIAGRAGTFTMTKVTELKQRADSVLEEVFRSLFEEIDTAKIRTDVEALKLGTPHFAEQQHANVLARRTALRCAAAGAVTGLPSGLLAIGTLGADLAYLIFQQFRLILGIATIYGHEPSNRERFNEALACFAYASGVGIGKQGIAAVMEVAALESGIVAEKIGAQFLRDRVLKIVPLVGAISGGALNYVSVRAVARAAIRYYESRVDPLLADEIWNEGDREHA